MPIDTIYMSLPRALTLGQVLWLMRLGSRLFLSRPSMPRTLPTRQAHASEEKGQRPHRAIGTYMLCHPALPLLITCSMRATQQGRSTPKRPQALSNRVRVGAYLRA